MDIKDWASAKDTAPLYRELKELNLLEHLAELEAFGYTILPPEKVGSVEQLHATKEAVIRIACERKNCSIGELENVFDDGQELLRFVLWDDEIFEKIILTPSALGLINWLVGTNCVLSLCNAWVKGKGHSRTGIHADWAQFEMPTMAIEPFTANFNYLLTDYTEQDGGLSFVPGSHKWRRLPSVEEAMYWKDNAQPVEAPAGSMIIWGDHTWHGSYPKTTDGLRLMLLGTFCRPHMQTQEAYRHTTTDSALARNPKRFARLMNVYHAMPWGKTPDYAIPGQGPSGYLSLLDLEPAGEELQVPKRGDYHQYDQKTGDAIKNAMSKKEGEFPDHYKQKNS
jgi:hypothetical protein